MPGKTLKTQAQQFVLNLLEYFEMEKENGGPLESLSSVQEVQFKLPKFIYSRDYQPYFLEGGRCSSNITENSIFYQEKERKQLHLATS